MNNTLGRVPDPKRFLIKNYAFIFPFILITRSQIYIITQYVVIFVLKYKVTFYFKALNKMEIIRF